MTYRTPLKAYIASEEYTAGDFEEESWEAIQEEDGTDIYYCNWSGTYGVMKVTLMTNGVIESANITMPYAPKLYEALKTKSVVFAKNAQDILTDGKPNSASGNCYELASGVDNVSEANRQMKFVVKRYEGK